MDNKKYYKRCNVSNSRDADGMTIIEILVVVAILSIMSGIGLFYINSNSFQLQSDVRNIRSTLMKARLDSIKLNKNITVTIYKDRYETSSGSVSYFIGNHKVMKSDFTDINDSGYSTTFTPTGRTTFPFHLRVQNVKGSYFSVCVNFAGRIWLMSNNPEPCTN